MEDSTRTVPQKWTKASATQRVMLLVALAMILAAAVSVIRWSMDKNYQILFSGLQEEDAGAIISELQNRKTPYRLADNGASVLVPEELLHETRLAMMASGAPIGGGVGFEIFDNQGLGATEQSQRVSYQRALQGELARTIGDLEDVRRARVHLVLPESTLFQRDQQEARAAVTLSLADGATLDRIQIVGIQRLVAASIANLTPAKVIITDQRGVTLSGATDVSVATGSSNARLTIRRETEEYILQKVVNLLDRTYGPGQAIVSVDVALNFDEVTRTVQGFAAPKVASRPISAHDGEDYDNLALINATEPSVNKAAGSVERIIAAPGGIERMSVGVIVPAHINAEQQATIRQLVSVVAGLNEYRGDAIVLQTLEQVGSEFARSIDAPSVILGATQESPQIVEQVDDTVGILSPISRTIDMRLAVATIGLLCLFLLLFFMRKKVTQSLTEKERNTLLNEIKQALSDNEADSYAGALP